MPEVSSYLENHLLGCLFLSIKILLSNGCVIKSHLTNQEDEYSFK